MSKKYLNNNLLNKFKKRKYLKSNVLLKSISQYMDEDDNESNMIKTSMLHGIRSKINNYNYIRDTLIKTEGIKKKIDLNDLYEKKETNFNKELEKAWVGRTNAPYKNIIKDEKKREFKSKEELIVHKVTEEDKKGLDESFEKFENKIENHNNELKSMYSISKELEHKEKFEYNHKYKYRIKHNPRDHIKMRNNIRSENEKEEINRENNRIKLDNLMDKLIKDGVLNENDIKTSSLN